MRYSPLLITAWNRIVLGIDKFIDYLRGGTSSAGQEGEGVIVAPRLRRVNKIKRDGKKGSPGDNRNAPCKG